MSNRITREAQPSIDDWCRAVPDLRKVGAQWQGPCPACGGTDRFHVQAATQRAGAMAHCRAGCDYERLLDAAGLMARRESARYRPERRRFPATQTATQTASYVPPYAPPIEIWKAAHDIEGTPAAVYLRSRRRVWPEGIPLPPSCRWLRRESTRDLHGVWIPDTAAGAVVFLYQARPGEAAAVSMEAITANGERAIHAGNRWRRTFGKAGGACCAVGAPGGSPVVVVEGEVSALAAVWLAEPGAQVLAAGSTSGMRNLFSVLARGGRPVEVWNDNDEPGRKAAFRLAHAYRRAGFPAAVKTNRTTDASGSDAADALQSIIETSGWPAHAQVAVNTER